MILRRRAGKHGTYNPKHNDRSFNLANSEHIDPERAKGNIYWDCFHGFRSTIAPQDPDDLAGTFSDVERQFYETHYSEFIEKFKARFGDHVHVLDWALHLDESTPHIHERHVFDCENRYGEVGPQQEKALEALGFVLPDPDKPLSRRNNRKITFDAACRKMLFEIAKRHGLELEEEAEYGNRKYLEKQDFILAKQKEQLAAQQSKLDELTLKVSDMETLREYTAKHLDGVLNKFLKTMQTASARLQEALLKPEVRQKGKEQVKEKARDSVLQLLNRLQAEQMHKPTAQPRTKGEYSEI